MSQVPVSLQQRIQWLLEDLQAYQPEKVIPFGSAARGDADEHSDLDVVIIKRTQEPFVQRGVQAVGNLRDQVFPVDLLVYTPQEFHGMVERGSLFIYGIILEG